MLVGDQLLQQVDGAMQFGMAGQQCDAVHRSPFLQGVKGRIEGGGQILGAGPTIGRGLLGKREHGPPLGRESSPTSRRQ